MSGQNIIFSDKKINKSSFYKNKKLFNIYDIVVNVSKKESYGKETHFKYFGSNKTMSFKVKNY